MCRAPALRNRRPRDGTVTAAGRRRHAHSGSGAPPPPAARTGTGLQPPSNSLPGRPRVRERLALSISSFIVVARRSGYQLCRQKKRITSAQGRGGRHSTASGCHGLCKTPSGRAAACEQVDLSGPAPSCPQPVLGGGNTGRSSLASEGLRLPGYGIRLPWVRRLRPVAPARPSESLPGAETFISWRRSCARVSEA